MGGIHCKLSAGSGLGKGGASMNLKFCDLMSHRSIHAASASCLKTKSLLVHNKSLGKYTTNSIQTIVTAEWRVTNDLHVQMRQRGTGPTGFSLYKQREGIMVITGPPAWRDINHNRLLCRFRPVAHIYWKTSLAWLWPLRLPNAVVFLKRTSFFFKNVGLRT